jgi:hypothetical protein
MKFLWGATLGATLVAWSVVAAGGKTALLFGAGVCVGAVISLWLYSFVGAGHPVKQGTGHPTHILRSASSGQLQSANVPKSQLATDRRGERRRKRSTMTKTMLSSVEQECLSALMNLGTSFRDAESAVRGSFREGQSFDELFRLAVLSLNVGKSRRAA